MSEAPHRLDATPDVLRKTLGRRPVLWVGAGVSVAAGLPSTRDLVAAMIADADDPIDASLPFEKVADAYVDSLGEGALANLLQRQIAASPPLPELHRAIARAAAEDAFAAIVTTNYDDLLERALGDAGVRLVVQSLEDNATVTDPDGLRLVKLHGSRDAWRRTVLSGRAYAEFEQRYRFLKSQLDVLLRREPVLFVGCSLQDPRIVDWLEALDGDARAGLKPWRALMKQTAWDEALAANAVLGRANLRPLVFEDHDRLAPLWSEVAPPRTPAAELALTVEVSAAGLRATLEDETWTPDDPLADEELVAAIAELRERGSRALPTDEHGALVPGARPLAAALREQAARIGETLAAKLLSPAARQQLRTAVGGAGRPALLRLRVAVTGDRDLGALTARADRLLALPWELLRVADRFPVEDHTLDVAREAVVPNLVGLEEPTEPLSIVATVAAPVGAVELDYEGEMYRLWRALGEDEQRLAVTDLGTVEDLAAAVKEHHPAVVHFTGHGLPGELLFEDEAARPKRVPVADLARDLRDAAEGRGLPSLIYLSSCHGASAGAAAPAATGQRSAESPTEEPAGAEQPERMVDVAAVATEPSTAAALHRTGFSQVVAYFGPVGDAQASRTSAAFYAALADGTTARAALRGARKAAVEPLADSDGVQRALYPLGWAQLVLYHRGADGPTAVASAAADARVRTPRRRIFERIDKAGGSERVEGNVGVQQLRFGFIGRRWPRGEALRRWRAGERVLVVEGLGGLGKTALCGELLRLFGRELPILALDGRFAGAQPKPILALWQEVQAARQGDAWSAELAAVQQGGLGGVQLAEAVALLARHIGGLIVYLDDAESLQEAPAPGATLGRWRDDEIRSWWRSLVSLAERGGRFALVASSRYRPEDTPEDALLNLPPMSRWEIVRLMTWLPTLRRLPPEDREWLTERVDGHPRTIEYLEVLAKRKSESLAPPGQAFRGNWRQQVLEPILEVAGQELDADLLLSQVWEALGND
ncbi:MAG: SIR2 family protein, partial [Thermoanaerobaculia bacterium]